MKRLSRWLTRTGLTCALLLGVARASAQEEVLADAEYVPDEEVTAPSSKLPDGLYPALSLGANLNLSDNSNVVGQVDGLSVLTGISIAGELHYLHGQHDFRNTLAITEAWSRTPTLPRFVKANDVLDFESLYKFFLWEQGGLYARANVLTTIFTTRRITAEDQDYAPEDDPMNPTETTDTFRQSAPFQPFTLSESLGGFIDPVQEPYLTVSVRAGFGGRHSLAKGARVITDDSGDSGAILYGELLDVHQAGLELFAGLDGRTLDDRIGYTAGVVALVPFINNDDSDRSALDLTRVAAQAGLTAAISDWASVSYQLRIVNDPQLIDKVQVQNNLLLTLAYTVVDKPEPPAEPDPMEAQLAAEKARADAAEERARAAEERAAAAEQAAGTAPTGEPANEPSTTPTAAPEPEPTAPEPTPAQPAPTDAAPAPTTPAVP